MTNIIRLPDGVQLRAVGNDVDDRQVYEISFGGQAILFEGLLTEQIIDFTVAAIKRKLERSRTACQSK